MQPQWSIQRRTVAHRDGERRLDQAYQHLLRWAQELSTAPQPQEANHESCHLCQSLNDPPGTGPDHRTTACTPASLYGRAGLDT